MKRVLCLCLAFVLALPIMGQAQSREETLADIRQDLNVLYVEIQKLKRELSTTSGANPNVATGGTLSRINTIEAELSRLTSLVETLDNRINRVVKDGTNRIGDLEFRLVELEGGDISKLGATTTLGGEAVTGAGTSASTTNTVELAVGEEADFKMALEAAKRGDNSDAATLFARFVQTYPGSPLTAQAHLERGKALEGAGDTKAAARAYLESFSNYQNEPSAPEALMRLGAALGSLGQTDAACQTLSQVEVRYAASDFVAPAQKHLATYGCQ
jgi:tol-pal system protein YbgF